MEPEDLIPGQLYIMNPNGDFDTRWRGVIVRFDSLALGSTGTARSANNVVIDGKGKIKNGMRCTNGYENMFPYGDNNHAYVKRSLNKEELW